MKEELAKTYSGRLLHRAKSNRLVRQSILAAGIISTLIGVIGIFLPILPTTPFLLLAATCFAFSSKKAYSWLMYNRWFGSYIRNYRAGRGLTLRVKVFTVSLLWLTIGYSVMYVVTSGIMKDVLLFIVIMVTVHVLTKPTYAGD